GPSGGGKSTLIKCIYGLEDLAGGEIFFNGERVLGPAYNLMPGHAGMKLVSQDYYVLDNHSVEENIKDMLAGYPDDYKEQRSVKLLKLLGLGPLKQLRAKQLSSGQKQRVAIARALAEFPGLLLLDEPFNNLDKILKDKLFDFIITEAKRKKSQVLLITHLAEEALKYADKIGIVMDGKIVQLDRKEQVYYHPKTTRIAKLMGDYNIISASDFESASAYRKKNAKTLLRPDQFRTVKEKKGCDLIVNHSTHFFNGKCLEVMGETKSGTMLVFYLPTASKILDNFYLRVISC
ncbi:MAG: ATP-binding cassette domain-containing protein, partial [Bacteroidia bacterium]